MAPYVGNPAFRIRELHHPTELDRGRADWRCMRQVVETPWWPSDDGVPCRAGMSSVTTRGRLVLVLCDFADARADDGDRTIGHRNRNR